MFGWLNRSRINNAVLYAPAASELVATYAAAMTRFGEQGVIDLAGINGYYALLAMTMNVARTAVPEGADASLPPRLSRCGNLPS